MIDEKLIEPPPPSYSPPTIAEYYPSNNVGYPPHAGSLNGSPGLQPPQPSSTLQYPAASPSIVPSSYPSTPDSQRPFLSPQPSPDPRQLSRAPQQQQRPMSADVRLGIQYQQQLLARCARGDHDLHRKHGVLGIVGAVLLFPIGLICLFLDSDEICSRCGAHV